MGGTGGERREVPENVVGCPFTQNTGELKLVTRFVVIVSGGFPSACPWESESRSDVPGVASRPEMRPPLVHDHAPAA